MINDPNITRSDAEKAASKNITSNFLRTVTEKEGFHFYIAIGEPTDKTAVSLRDFVEKLDNVNVRSVNFHYLRKDFEKWLLEVIGDTELASRINMISRMHIGIKGEALRNQIIRIVKVRLSEIKPQPLATSKPTLFGAAAFH